MDYIIFVPQILCSGLSPMLVREDKL